jgi:hypothetical protein
MTIKLITFKTAHTILGDVTELPEGFKVKEPVQVIMQPSKEGPMMAFAPFLEYADEFRTGITFSRDDILCVTTPVRELGNQYNQVFGSGITIASAIPKV